jgi:hypothetical protein
MKEAKNYIKELSWQDIRAEFNAVNPKLTAIIDEISPDPSYKIFKASYAFGEEMLKNGQLQVPDEAGNIIPLNAAKQNIIDALSYNYASNPVSMVLSGSSEIFIILENHTIPLYGLIPPGKIFGSWVVLSRNPSTSSFIWGMTSGARSLFMLPKISKMQAHKRIAKELGLNQNAPKNILEHWSVFREIANHPGFGEQWKCKISFFSEKWFVHLNDPIFKDLKLYLLEEAWNSSDYWRNQFMLNLTFSLIQKEQNIKLSSYMFNIVKHLLSMGAGAMPGYAPAIDDSAAPVQRLQEMYSSIYNVPYTPTIMQPLLFSLDSDRPVYFSFAFPSMLEFSGKSREDSSKLDDLLSTYSYLNKYLYGLENNNLNIEQTPFSLLPRRVQFDFYHTDFSRFTSLRDPREIVLEDKNFGITSDKIESFPAKSAFLRGCVRVSKKLNP